MKRCGISLCLFLNSLSCFASLNIANGIYVDPSRFLQQKNVALDLLRRSNSSEEERLQSEALLDVQIKNGTHEAEALAAGELAESIKNAKWDRYAHLQKRRLAIVQDAEAKKVALSSSRESLDQLQSPLTPKSPQFE